MNELITISIIIKQDLSTIYDQWLEIESFPSFVNRVHEVKRISAKRSRWRALVPLGIEVEWDAEITTLEPNKRIAWRGESEKFKTAGQVTFNKLSHNRVELTLLMKYAILDEEVAVIYEKLKEDSENSIRYSLNSFKKHVELFHNQFA